MTLIACTLNYSKPVLVGDILISSDDAKESIQLPTNSINITKYLGEKGSYGVTLNQKIYIINKNVAIALAGKVLAMTEFLKEFKLRCRYFDPIREDDIIAFLKEQNLEHNFNGFAFLILLVTQEEGQNHVTCLTGPGEYWKKSKSKIFEEIFACGTGAENFVHSATEQQEFGASSQQGSIYRAIAANYVYLAKLLAAERVSLFTTKDDWGAGYEMIVYMDESFAKLDKIGYITCHGQFTEKGEVELLYPGLIQYYLYHKDVLFIVSIEIQKWSAEETTDHIFLRSKDFKPTVFVVPPIDSENGAEIIPPALSFTTGRIAFGFAITKGNKSPFVPSYFTEGEMVVTYRDPFHLELIYRKSMFEQIKEGARKAYPSIEHDD